MGLHICDALLIDQGAHPRAIMERLGHSSISVTIDAYDHLFPARTRSSATAWSARTKPIAASHQVSCDADAVQIASQPQEQVRT